MVRFHVGTQLLGTTRRSPRRRARGALRGHALAATRARHPLLAAPRIRTRKHADGQRAPASLVAARAARAARRRAAARAASRAQGRSSEVGSNGAPPRRSRIGGKWCAGDREARARRSKRGAAPIFGVGAAEGGVAADRSRLVARRRGAAFVAHRRRRPQRAARHRRRRPTKRPSRETAPRVHVGYFGIGDGADERQHQLARNIEHERLLECEHRERHLTSFPRRCRAERGGPSMLGGGARQFASQLLDDALEDAVRARRTRRCAAPSCSAPTSTRADHRARHRRPARPSSTGRRDRLRGSKRQARNASFMALGVWWRIQGRPRRGRPPPAHHARQRRPPRRPPSLFDLLDRGRRDGRASRGCATTSKEDSGRGRPTRRSRTGGTSARVRALMRVRSTRARRRRARRTARATRRRAVRSSMVLGRRAREPSRVVMKALNWHRTRARRAPPERKAPAQCRRSAPTSRWPSRATTRADLSAPPPPPPVARGGGAAKRPAEEEADDAPAAADGGGGARRRRRARRRRSRRTTPRRRRRARRRASANKGAAAAPRRRRRAARAARRAACSRTRRGASSRSAEGGALS